MDLSILQDARLYDVLHRLDVDLAQTTRASGCPHCGAVVHVAHYRRKPRGGPRSLSQADVLRFSFCCARDGCRRRKTPPSVRFLGRRVYLGMAMLLAVSFEGPLTTRRMARLRDRLGVDERTLRRWRAWWREGLPRSAFWKGARADFIPALDTARLPLCLLGRFAGIDLRDVVAKVLRWLSPLSVSGAF